MGNGKKQAEIPQSKSANRVMRVAIIGQGYVGLPLSMAISAAGYEVVGFDLNSDVVESLNNGNSHVEDISNKDLATSLRSGKYFASSNPKDLGDIDIAIIAVPTPLNDDRLPDLTFVESASEIIGKNLNKEALIINESTSYPGTLREVIAPIVAKNSKLNHLFAISPERVDPGNSKWGIKNTPRLFAGMTPEAGRKTAEFYSSFCDEIIEVSSPEVAESAKLFENTFRQVNIALVNELSLICNKLGISAHKVLEAASSKPYGFMKFTPGIGVGGHCIPVDPTYLAFAAKSVGSEARFIEMANEVNLSMPSELIKRIKQDCGENLSGKKIVVYGIAYKPNIADYRESPSLSLISQLRNEGAIVSWHDPLVKNWSGEQSCALSPDLFDIGVAAIIHDAMDKNDLKIASKYLIDCTSKLEGAVNF
jgi:UDP-N-acetyl-D-glucosamine dehydrogenase